MPIKPPAPAGDSSPHVVRRYADLDAYALEIAAREYALNNRVIPSLSIFKIMLIFFIGALFGLYFAHTVNEKIQTIVRVPCPNSLKENKPIHKQTEPPISL